jgi:hypothetical protein
MSRVGDRENRRPDRQSRHRSAQSVLGYLEPADLWRSNVFGRAAADGERDLGPA